MACLPDLFAGITARDYVRTRICRKIERAERQEYRGGGPEGCRKQFALIERYWLPELDNAPHIRVHGDLGPKNIIVDEEFDLKRCKIYQSLHICYIYLRYVVSSIWGGRIWFRSNLPPSTLVFLPMSRFRLTVDQVPEPSLIGRKGIRI